MDLTYFQSLIIFILPPLIITILLVWRKKIVHRYESAVILIHVILALVYTTPWDNYLVATGVWMYNPEKISGILIGYVPLEEYIFFVLQTLLTGLWIVVLLKTFQEHRVIFTPDPRLRMWTALTSGLIGLISLGVLVSGSSAGRYTALILVWASIPITIQFFFGADILWGKRRILTWGILAPTLYLWIMDLVSISAGVWTINPSQITGISFGPLPIEEMLFFLVTNSIIVMGITLFLSSESTARLAEIRMIFKKSSL